MLGASNESGEMLLSGGDFTEEINAMESNRKSSSRIKPAVRALLCGIRIGFIGFAR